MNLVTDSIFAYLCCCRSMARATVPLNFNAFLEKAKLKDDGSNYTDWVRNLRIILIAALWGPRLISRDHRKHVYSDPRDQCSLNTQKLNNKSLISIHTVSHR